MVSKSDLFLLRDTPEAPFLTFCTSHKLARWLQGPSGPCEKSQGRHMTGTCSIFRCPYIYTFDLGSKRAKMVTFGTFSDLDHPLDGFKTSDEWTGHLPRWCGRADIRQWVTNHGNITPGSPEKHPFELILASGGTFSGLN